MNFPVNQSNELGGAGRGPVLWLLWDFNLHMLRYNPYNYGEISLVELHPQGPSSCKLLSLSL